MIFDGEQTRIEYHKLPTEVQLTIDQLEHLLTRNLYLKITMVDGNLALLLIDKTDFPIRLVHDATRD